MAHTEPGVAGVNRSDGFSGEGAILPRELYFSACRLRSCAVFLVRSISSLLFCEHFSRLLWRIISVSRLKQALGGGPKRVPTIKPANFVPMSMTDNDSAEPSRAGLAASTGERAVSD